MPKSTKQLPEFKSPSTAEMRLMWRSYPDENVRRLILEVDRLRGVLLSIEGYRMSIDRAWKQETRSQLVGLHCLRLLIAEELSRAGYTGAEIPEQPGAEKRFP